MEDILTEFENRRALLRNMNYHEAGARISGFYNWMIEQDEIRAIIDQLMSSINVDNIIENRPPNASSFEEVAATGLLFMKQIRDGDDPVDLTIKYGIEAPYGFGGTMPSNLNELMTRYIDPAVDFIYRELTKSITENRAQIDLNQQFTSKISYPLEITESLQKFFQDHPDFDRNAFVMMSFGETKAHTAIINAIRGTLGKYGIEALRADDKEYHEDLFPNVLTYIHGCKFGVAIFERLEEEYFNPNVSLEVGYIRALHKPICLLKDKTLKMLNTDLVGKLYKSFDPQEPEKTIPTELEKWLRDKEIIT
jgi:hypothetical protein